jgi:hypothetical protein
MLLLSWSGMAPVAQSLWTWLVRFVNSAAAPLAFLDIPSHVGGGSLLWCSQNALCMPILCCPVIYFSTKCKVGSWTLWLTECAHRYQYTAAH